MENIFTSIYENKIWGNNDNPEYNGSSGEGSGVDVNKDTYVPFLKNFIVENNIKSVVDLGCGDFRCGKLIYDDLDVSYTGYDAYAKVVEYNASQHSKPKYSFHHLDFCKNVSKIQSADMCILKDVIQHWSLIDIYNFLDYLTMTNKKFKYILICNCCDQRRNNTEITNGDFRPLCHKFLPLKRYNPIHLYNYHTKEVCVIKL